MKTYPHLSIQGLILRQPHEYDCDSVVAQIQDTDIHKWTVGIPYPYTPFEFKRWCSMSVTNFNNGHSVAFVIERDREVVGCISILTKSILHKRVELSYWVGSNYRNQRIATNSVRVCRWYATNMLVVNKVVAFTLDGNTASERTLQSCLFFKEAYMREHFLKDGELVNATMWSYFQGVDIP